MTMRKWRRPWHSSTAICCAPKTSRICVAANLNRKPECCAQPALRAFFKRQLAAMRPRNIARNSKTQTAAAGLQIAAFVQAMERAERFLAQGFGNAGPVIVHQNGDG